MGDNSETEDSVRAIMKDVCDQNAGGEPSSTTEKKEIFNASEDNNTNESIEKTADPVGPESIETSSFMDDSQKTLISQDAKSSNSEEDKSDDGSTEKVSEGSDKERPAWDNKFQYIMAALGFAVGLGNIWRFPYLCQKNGGGAFLIPYFLMLFLMGYPLYFLELAVGQSIRKGAVGVWSSIDPRLIGVGFASIVVSLLIGLYYNMILAWTLFYLGNSFRTTLPWSECPMENGTEIAECAASSPTDYFWYRTTLDISDSIETGGTLNWKMVLSLLAAWILVFFGIIKGIKSSGKVMYFATIFPYLILIAFFIRGMTLEGAADGVVHMFSPDVEKLKDPVVWREAATQIFFSLGLGYGAIIAYSSYNPIYNNCKKDAMFVATANSITSVFACITVFSVLGFKAKLATNECRKTNKLSVQDAFPDLNFSGRNSSYGDFLNEVLRLNETYPDQIADLEITNWNCSLETELAEIGQGTGLAFIAFAETILMFPGAPVWACLFFFMLLCIGMSSEFGILQGFITMVLDASSSKIKKWKLTAILCFCMFLIGLMFTTRSGSYFLDIFDGYSATFGLVAIALFETIAASWVYGLDPFLKDIENMLGTGARPGYYWQISWKYTCPIAMAIILIASFIDLFIKYPTYSSWDPFVEGSKVKQPYPGWAIFIIAFLILSSVLCIPIFALLVHFGIINPKTFGVNPAGQNRRGEYNEAGTSESATPLYKV